MARWPELVRGTGESDADYATRAQEEKEDRETWERNDGEFAVPVQDVPEPDVAKLEAEPNLETKPKPCPKPCLKPRLKPQRSLATLLARFSLPSQLLPPRKPLAGIAILGVLVLGVVFVTARKSRVK
jgi:hypothetical protein